MKQKVRLQAFRCGEEWFASGKPMVEPADEDRRGRVIWRRLIRSYLIAGRSRHIPGMITMANFGV